MLGLFILISLVSFAKPNLIEMFSNKDNQPTLEQVQSAIESGLDINAVNKYGNTALIRASSSNQNPDIITALIKVGTDINAKDKDSKTALMTAAWSNENPDIISALVKSGAEINAKCETNDRTALMFAIIKNSNPNVAATLVKLGANVNAKDIRDRSCLGCARLYRINDRETYAAIINVLSKPDK